MRADEVRATCPTCGTAIGSEAVGPSDDTGIREITDPYVRAWLLGPPHEVADERQLHLKDPMGVVPGWDLRWAHTQHRGSIVIYQHLGQRQVEFIRLTDDWEERFLDR